MHCTVHDMNKIKQHVTSSARPKPQEDEFYTLDELLDIAFVKEWTHAPGFSRYSQMRYTDDMYLLIAEFNEGKVWCKVGFIWGDSVERILRQLPVFVDIDAK